MITVLPLWCAGKLGNCPQGLTRFRFSCLFCRWRRRFYGKFSDPPFWICYTYLSLKSERLVDCYVKNGLVFEASNGRPLKITTYKTLEIDPRGHFTRLRCAAIIVLDWVMKVLNVGKPLAEFCEFLANYPTW